MSTSKGLKATAEAIPSPKDFNAKDGEKALPAIKRRPDASGRVYRPSEDNTPIVWWQVVDTNATAGARSHELRCSRTGRIEKFTFKDQFEATPVPMNFATALTALDGFEVYNHVGDLIEVAEVNAANGGFSLRTDQTIASYEELSIESLVRRANEVEGADFDDDSKKEDLIEFLIRNKAQEIASYSNISSAKKTEDDAFAPSEGNLLADDDEDPFA